jgi:signal transduction histidine kinase
VEVREFVQATADLAKPFFDEKALMFEVILPEAPVTIRTDRHRAAQILTNLLTNAAKFTGSGGVTLEVHVSPADVEFAVSDTGPGIPTGEREAIFERFHQLPSAATAKSAGTGLGLAIARELAGLLGGVLSVGDSESGGARFELRLPRKFREDA